MNKTARGLEPMINSDFFTIEHCIQYLHKYRSNKDVLSLLVTKLETYHPHTFFDYLTELVFFSLNNEFRPLEMYFLKLCAVDFCYFYLISGSFEIWGHQFLNLNNKSKKRVRHILEDCETSMVNGIKNPKNIKYNSENPEIDEQKLIESIMVKRCKNDFKDEVKYFTFYLIKLTHVLLKQEKEEHVKTSQNYLQKLNLHLYQRRNSEEKVLQANKFMSEGIIIPFGDKSNSNIVR